MLKHKEHRHEVDAGPLRPGRARAYYRSRRTHRSCCDRACPRSSRRLGTRVLRGYSEQYSGFQECHILYGLSIQQEMTAWEPGYPAYGREISVHTQALVYSWPRLFVYHRSTSTPSNRTPRCAPPRLRASCVRIIYILHTLHAACCIRAAQHGTSACAGRVQQAGRGHNIDKAHGVTVSRC